MFNKKASEEPKDAPKAANPETTADPAFQNAWFSLSPDPQAAAPQKKMSPAQRNLDDIKKYAYEAFDLLDTNQNGFIEASELHVVLADPATPMREKSFVMFLLSNQQEIADSVQEGTPEYRDGISRLDIEQYFKIVMSRIA
jgi:hypothetical protein